MPGDNWDWLDIGSYPPAPRPPQPGRAGQDHQLKVPDEDFIGISSYLNALRISGQTFELLQRPSRVQIAFSGDGEQLAVVPAKENGFRWWGITLTSGSTWVAPVPRNSSNASRARSS